MSWNTVADVVAAVLMLGGSFFVFAAGVGVARFPDLLGRMHAATKPQVLGLIMLLAGVGLRVHDWGVVGMLVLVAIFQLLTAPVAAHMVGRAGYRTGKVDVSLLALDELTPDQDEATAEAEAERAAGDGTPPPGADGDGVVDRTP